MLTLQFFIRDCNDSLIPFFLIYMNVIKSYGFNYHLYLFNSQSISLILTPIMNSSIIFLIAYRAFSVGSECITVKSTEFIITPHRSALKKKREKVAS